MRIGINLLYLIPGIVGGTESYAAGLLHGLAGVDQENEYVVFVNKESASWEIPQSAQFRRIVCPVKAIHRVRRYYYEQIRFPQLLKKYDLDLVHSLGYVGPLRNSCPAIVTVPDLNFLAIGHTMPRAKRAILQCVSVQAAKRAAAVITISAYSKKMIAASIRVPPDKIIVTLLGPRWNHDVGRNIADEDVLEMYGIAGPYIVAFSSRAGHKNISRLILAYKDIIKNRLLRLIIIGHLSPDLNPKEFPEGVKAIGYIPDEHIQPILSGARALVFPSLYEGFGLPVLEAQQAGVPLVCSTAGSLPEIAGEGAVFFDPYSVDEMAEKISLVIDDESRRGELKQKGFRNLEKYSWEKTAMETIAVYRRVWRERVT